jgi:AraC-like DNA-binding protein
VTSTLDRALASLEWTLLESRRDPMAAGSWFDRSPGSAGFYYVLRGRAEVRTGTERIELTADDLLFLTFGGRHEVHALTEADLVNAVFAPAGSGRQTLQTFPETVLVRRFGEHEPTIVGLIGAIVCGNSAGSQVGRLGGSVICSRIATTIVSAAVRSWTELGGAPDRWMQRIADPDVAQALDALHTDPGRAWTVADLARVAMMSRSAFAERFRDVVGQTPATYLASVRMQAGMELLARDGLSVAETARRLGYASDAGFSRAFRRHTGSSPALWRRGAMWRRPATQPGR